MTRIRDDSFVIAVDSGGTFTDTVVTTVNGRVWRSKAASTPEDPSVGVINSLEAAAATIGIDLQEMLARAVLFAHGTTLPTNALLTRSGSLTALLTTAGHEDALAIGRVFQKVAGLTENERARVSSLAKPSPIVPRSLIRGINERVDAGGEIVVPLAIDEVRRALDQLVAAGVDALAVCFLWSFKNAAHEGAVVELARRDFPQLVVSASSELAPVVKEYERTVTTVVNAYLRRTTESYLLQLDERLRANGFGSVPAVMQSSGGVMALRAAAASPVRLLLSGPAGGVIGAQVVAEALGYRSVITTDVGGTSFDVGLIIDGEPVVSDTAVFDQYQLLLPAIDIATIGAGGGSVAWVEEDTGVLRVGPQSAGAVPGPACYGRGGLEPTVTDANVVLGRINPENFLGGRHRLDVEAAETAVARVASSLGMTLTEAAHGIVEIADAHMADLVRKVTVERGFDPSNLVLFAFGGAGPLHAASYGPAVGCQRVVIPAAASAFSALGIAASDLVVVEELSEPMPEPFDAKRIAGVFEKLAEEGRRRLSENGVTDEAITVGRFARMRYRGQVHEVEVPIPEGDVDESAVPVICEHFANLYEARFGHGTSYRRAGIQIITFRIRATGRLYPLRLRQVKSPDGDATPAQTGERPVYFGRAGGFIPTAIYAAERLSPGDALSGPLIVEAVDTTILVHPHQTLTVDALGNFAIVGGSQPQPKASQPTAAATTRDRLHA